MNWLDFVLIGIFAVALLQGLKLGLLGAAVTAIGAVVGWQLAGQLSDDVGGLFGGAGDTVTTVVAYIIVVVLSMAAIRFVYKIVRPFLIVIPIVPLADRLGGVALGLVAGLAIAGAVVIILVRFAYDFDLPEQGVVGQVAGRIPDPQRTRDSVEDALTDSTLVPIFVDIARAIPGGALGFVPFDFEASFEILDQRIEQDSAP
jgi:uncharacterized membrane protein required for colicin V production